MYGDQLSQHTPEHLLMMMHKKLFTQFSNLCANSQHRNLWDYPKLYTKYSKPPKLKVPTKSKAVFEIIFVAVDHQQKGIVVIQKFTETAVFITTFVKKNMFSSSFYQWAVFLSICRHKSCGFNTMKFSAYQRYKPGFYIRHNSFII